MFLFFGTNSRGYCGVPVVIREMAPIGEMAPGCGKRIKKEILEHLIVFSHPHRRDGTGCDISDINPRVSATAPGPRGDIRAPLVSRTIAIGTCVVSTLFMRGNEYLVVVFI